MYGVSYFFSLIRINRALTNVLYRINKKTGSRQLLTYSRRPIGDTDEEDSEHYRQAQKKGELGGKTADELNDFRRKVCFIILSS